MDIWSLDVAHESATYNCMQINPNIPNRLPLALVDGHIKCKIDRKLLPVWPAAHLEDELGGVQPVAIPNVYGNRISNALPPYLKANMYKGTA